MKYGDQPGQLEQTEIRIVVLHRPEPYVGHDPMRTCLDALTSEQDTLVVENAFNSTPTEVEVPQRLRKERP